MSRDLTPYARLLGIEVDGDRLIMPFSPALIGAPGRLHGGAVAGLMELAGNLAVHRAVADESARLKPIGVTVDFLREGGLETSFARAEIVKLGRRVVNVRTLAWQGDPDRPIAAAGKNILISRPSSSG
jgi:uncharacterized protein (TIGR00369 family)